MVSYSSTHVVLFPGSYTPSLQTKLQDFLEREPTLIYSSTHVHSVVSFPGSYTPSLQTKLRGLLEGDPQSTFTFMGQAQEIIYSQEIILNTAIAQTHQIYVISIGLYLWRLCSLVPRLPHSRTQTLKLCRRREPGIFSHVSSV